MALKKTIETYSEFDSTGRWTLCVKKTKGKLTLDEIIEAAREYSWDFYLAFIDAYNEPDEITADIPGDFVRLYLADDLLRGNK